MSQSRASGPPEWLIGLEAAFHEGNRILLTSSSFGEGLKILACTILHYALSTINKQEIKSCRICPETLMGYLFLL